MGKRFWVLAAAIIAVLWTLPGAATAQAPAITAAPAVHSSQVTIDRYGTETYQTDGSMDTAVIPAGVERALLCTTGVWPCPYNSYTFGTNWICQDDDIGTGTYYPTITAGNQFEAGQSNVVLANDNNETTADCVNYTDAQTIRYTLFDAFPDQCIKASGNWVDTWGWKKFTTTVQVQINRACDLYGAQWRANMTSRITGHVLGLTLYNEPSETGCVQNFAHAREYWYAGDCDTSRLYWMPFY